MAQKFLCVLATFDEETSRRMREIEHFINQADIFGRQTPGLPHHLTLAKFDVSHEIEIMKILQAVSLNTKRFSLPFNHIGLFGLQVLFLTPDVNTALLELRENFEGLSIKEERGWTAHATLLIDEAENIQRALPIVAQHFQHFEATVQSLVLYEFFPVRRIAEYHLR